MFATFGSFTNVYRQAVVVMESSSKLPNTYTPNPAVLDPSGNYARTTTQLFPSDSVNYYSSKTESVVLKASFSSVPVVWDSELRLEYQELGIALGELTELEAAGEWKIDAPVYTAACYVAAELMANSFPAPRVFNHGPKSVVFNWSKERDNLYLTVSADHVSALISSPARIERRIDLSANTSLALTSIRAAYLEEPVKLTGAVSGPSEFQG